MALERAWGVVEPGWASEFRRRRHPPFSTSSNHVAQQQNRFAKGDRIGVLLGLGAGWLRLYRNGKRRGPGPLVRVVWFAGKGDQVMALPAAVAPEGAGVADEPWE